MRARAAIAAGLLFVSLPAFGCGHCLEDRAAAVYDHAVVVRALDRRHQVAFFALEGPMAPGVAWRRVIGTALAAEKGVDAASVRVSEPFASVSLAYDDRRTSPARIGATLDRGLAARGLRASLLKVMAEPRAAP